MKKNIKRNLATLLLMAAVVIPLVSCGGGGVTSSSEDNLVDQVINVTVFDKFIASDVTVELYDSENNLAYSGVTNENGVATIKIDPEKEYNIKVDTNSTGYYVDQEYKTSTTGEEVTVNCLTKLIPEAPSSSKSYEFGSLFHDFSFTNSEGETKVASELLNEYDAIFINLWYTTCGFCVQEFPLIEQAYALYGDRVAFVALDPYDSIKDIRNFKSTYKLTFDMGMDTPLLSLMLNVTGFPYSGLIDRYGILSNVHRGAFQSMLDLDLFFKDYLVEDYVPDVLVGAVSKEEVDDGKILPNIDMPASSELEAAANGEGYEFSYYPETNEKDAPYSWPFIVSEDGKSMRPSNYTIDDSFSIVYSDIVIPKNTALAFDYKSSTEEDCDILYMLLNGEIYAAISGESDGWQTCYPYVTQNKSESLTLAFIYMKDEGSSVGEDTVYINNLRFVPEDEIPVPTYILRTCYKGTGISGNLLFITPVFNEEDGYYHVDSVDGPIIFASLLKSTLWNDFTLLDIANNDLLSDVNGVDYTELITRYAGYAVSGGYDLVPVNQELKDALDAIAQAYPAANVGNKEWMLMCNYYSAYGTDEEFKDPTVGLSPHSAPIATLGKNVINYNSTIVPRGKYTKFIPETSGVYKVYTVDTLTGDATIDAGLDHTTIGWIFDSELNLMVEGLANGRECFVKGDVSNLVMYAYFEAGETYYINCAFDDLYRYTDLTFYIEYIGESHEYLVACAPGYFTTEGVDEEGNMIGDIIHGGIAAQLGEDGYYHHLKEDGTLGSIIYCDFIYPNVWVTGSILEMIEADFFNFTRDENGNIVAGSDYTEEISAYIEKINLDETSETFGMVPVDEELATILQAFVDRHGFPNVYQGWVKFCYYYQHIGA